MSRGGLESTRVDTTFLILGHFINRDESGFCVLCMQVCRAQRRASGVLLDLCLLNLELGQWSGSLKILQSLPPSHCAEVTDVHVTMPSFLHGSWGYAHRYILILNPARTLTH